MIVKFGDVAERLNIKVDQSNTDLEVYVGGEHIDSNELLVHRCAPIKGSTIGYQFQFGFEQNDVLFMTKNPHLRKASMAPFRGLCSIATFVIRTKAPAVLVQEYLAIVMQSDDFWNYCEQHKSGGVNYFINWGTLSQFPFELPPIETQKEISNKVWAAYRLKEAYQRLLAATDEMVKSQFLEMTRTADRHPIGQLCDIFGGATPARTNKEYWENGTCPWFTVEDLHNQGAHIWKTEQHITEAALKKVKKYPVDTVLLCCTSATIGSVAYSHIPLSSNQQFNGLVVKDRNKLRPEFLFYNCTLLKDELLKQCGKTTFAFVPRGTLEKIEIFCPDIHVQNQFVKVLEQADKSKFELKRAIEAVDKVIKSLING